ncbi:MAG: lysylphosphatidylglycerol synthase domain-containing protein [Dictyoglomaceae bacterium]|nr:lysylphosphatidylglycerol synthase domain-containing protein [Dictyoglomaceae bacterium]
MIIKDKKNFIINITKLFITLFVFYFISKKIPTKEIFYSLSFVNIPYLILAGFFGALFTFLKILKWHLLLKDLSFENSFLNSMDSYFIGMSLGLITPGRLGEVARVGNINKEKRIEGISLVILDKIFDLLVVLILALWGFYFFFGISISILIGILIIFSLIIIFNPKIFKKLTFFYFKPLSKLIEGISNLKRKTLILNFLFSFLSYFLVLVEVYFLANSFEKFSLVPTIICYPLVMLVNLIPITIGGLGVREGTAIFLLGKFSLSSTTAFNSAFLLFLINTALPALIGVAIINKDLLKNNKINIIIITILGALLRIYKISERSIWLDEAITAQVSQRGIIEIILNRSQTGIHPPLYFILMHLWIRFFGDSEFALRFFSFIFGVLSIPLLYKFVNKIYDRNTALISSLLFSLSPFAIYFSQEARMYPLFTFLALLSLNFLYDLVSKEFSRKNLIKILIVNSVLLYTHFFSTLLILVENLFILITQRKNHKNLKNWFLYQFINLIIFSPWIYIILTRRTPEVYQGAEKLSMDTILISFHQIFLGFMRNFLERRNLSSLALITFIILFLLGILPHKNKKGFLLNILYFFIPFLFLIFVSLFGKSFYSSRYLSPFVPGIFIFISRGIKKLKFYPLIIIIIFALVGLYSILDVSYYLHMKTLDCPWKDVVAFIHENSDPSHKVLITEAYYYRPFEYYNRGKLQYIPVNPDFFIPEKLIKELSSSKRFWFVLSDHNERTLKTKNWLDNNFKNKGKKEFYKVSIYLYEN